MITEDYVSFETAKLLKEKGFDGHTNCYYIEGSVHKNLCYSPIRQNHNKRIINNEFDINIDVTSSKISAPTLQMAMKWLREVHNLEIYPFHDTFQECTTWWYRIEHYKKGCASVKDESDSIYGTYEQVCEAAIKYCLENLI